MGEAGSLEETAENFNVEVKLERSNALAVGSHARNGNEWSLVGFKDEARVIVSERCNRDEPFCLDDEIVVFPINSGFLLQGGMDRHATD